jgi:CheY-like chemotaxis protein
VDEEPAVTPPARERAGRGEGTILVVDDEPMVARATVRLLESLGYRAAYVDDPRQVVPMLQQDPELFDLIILDMQMPGMSGPECLAAIRQVRPDLPVLVTSGYAGEGAIARVQEAGAAGFVPKPYSLPQLAEAVRRALGA